MNNSDDNKPSYIPICQVELDVDKFSTKPDLDRLTMLATQNLVLLPGVTAPLSLVSENSLRIVNEAYENKNPIAIVCLRNNETSHPSVEDLYSFGVWGYVVKVLELPDNTHTAILKGCDKIEIKSLTYEMDELTGHERPVASVDIIREIKPKANDQDFISIINAIKTLTIESAEKSESMGNLLISKSVIPDGTEFVNMIISHGSLPIPDKVQLLMEKNVKNRAKSLLEILTVQEQMMRVAQEIQSQARNSFDQQHRAAFLQQQMEAIKHELYGDNDESEELRKRALEVPFTEAARKVFDKEVEKLQRLNPQSPDYSVQYTYLETLLDLPWQTYNELNSDLALARKILDADHYGLKKVKQRILEQIAVLINNPEGKAPILCLVGPPGVGKTSLGQSIARALGRSYQRVSLGGLHDEAEIRGHRRTYIGSMPGRIIDAIKRAGDSNPVLLLDEVDKIGADFKGDPSAALLEVLDPEQNSHFHDNYIDIDYDLSKVLFIATANTLSTLSQPLLDRMEIIDLSGYLLEEKVEIATRHIIPRLLAENKLKKSDVNIPAETIAVIIEKYTSESGVRQLEKEISSIIRKVILHRMLDEKVPKKILPKHLNQFLGAEKYSKDRYEGNSFAGVVTGLAWTAVGGEILFIETSLSKTKGDKLVLTGNLGNVMKESAAIALQYVQSHHAEFGIPETRFDKFRLHLHVPEGAIPKDGPSAGITMATSMVSAFTQRKVRDHIAMTGEITLRGKVLPVGGIKEKILAAKRAGITNIILSSQNEKDIKEIDEIYLEGITFHYVDTVSDVIKIALLPDLVDNPIPLDD